MFESYGQRRHGHTRNAGVIGVAVFEETRRPAPERVSQENPAWRQVGYQPGAAGPRGAVPPDA
jgi:hypothetical protein